MMEKVENENESMIPLYDECEPMISHLEKLIFIGNQRETS